MPEVLLIVLRFAQYLAAAILCGSSLLLVYGFPRRARVAGARALVLGGAALLSLSALLALPVQTAVMAGSFGAAADPSLLGIVAAMPLGKAAFVRAGCGLLAIAALLVARRPSARSWLLAGTLGLIAAASFAWSGHAGAAQGSEAALLLAADAMHAVAAACWVGALVAFLLALRGIQSRPSAARNLAIALRRFALAGSMIVALLVLTGLANTWFIVGPDGIGSLFSTTYGRLLSLKLVLFAAMIALAAINRLRLAPALDAQLLSGDAAPVVAALRLSVANETALGIAVLALVGWFGTLAPPGA